MEEMESEQTWERLINYLESEKQTKSEEIGNNNDSEEEASVKEKYFGLSPALKERLYYRLHGPRFPRDMDAAVVGEKNN